MKHPHLVKILQWASDTSLPVWVRQPGGEWQPVQDPTWSPILEYSVGARPSEDRVVLEVRSPLGRPGTPEVEALLDAYLATYNYPSNPKNAARAGWEAAQSSLAVRLVPIETSPDDPDREYIPLPGGWEIQTKGQGSSFRICDTKTGRRIIVIQELLHPVLTTMAREVRASIKTWNQI